jgi:hypothetical protein
MIAIAKPTSEQPAAPWHETFLEMLPKIQRLASLAYRGLPAETREDLIEEVIAHAVVAFKALHDKGKVNLAYPSVLAMHGIKRTNIGRRVGVKMNVRDVSSKYCRLAKTVQLTRLDKSDADDGTWQEVLVEDKHAGPAEIAAARIDVGDWFSSLPSRDRKIAGALAVGNTTGEVAKMAGVTDSRISSKRREYRDSYHKFQGEQPTRECA